MVIESYNDPRILGFTALNFSEDSHLTVQSIDYFSRYLGDNITLYYCHMTSSVTRVYFWHRTNLTSETSTFK